MAETKTRILGPEDLLIPVNVQTRAETVGNVSQNGLPRSSEVSSGTGALTREQKREAIARNVVGAAFGSAGVMFPQGGGEQAFAEALEWVGDWDETSKDPAQQPQLSEWIALQLERKYNPSLEHSMGHVRAYGPNLDAGQRPHSMRMPMVPIGEVESLMQYGFDHIQDIGPEASWQWEMDEKTGELYGAGIVNPQIYAPNFYSPIQLKGRIAAQFAEEREWAAEHGKLHEFPTVTIPDVHGFAARMEAETRANHPHTPIPAATVARSAGFANPDVSTGGWGDSESLTQVTAGMVPMPHVTDFKNTMFVQKIGVLDTGVTVTDAVFFEEHRPVNIDTSVTMDTTEGGAIRSHDGQYRAGRGVRAKIRKTVTGTDSTHGFYGAAKREVDVVTQGHVARDDEWAPTTVAEKINTSAEIGGQTRRTETRSETELDILTKRRGRFDGPGLKVRGVASIQEKIGAYRRIEETHVRAATTVRREIASTVDLTPSQRAENAKLIVEQGKNVNDAALVKPTTTHHESEQTLTTDHQSFTEQWSMNVQGDYATGRGGFISRMLPFVGNVVVRNGARVEVQAHATNSHELAVTRNGEPIHMGHPGMENVVGFAAINLTSDSHGGSGSGLGRNLETKGRVTGGEMHDARQKIVATADVVENNGRAFSTRRNSGRTGPLARPGEVVRTENGHTHVEDTYRWYEVGKKTARAAADQFAGTRTGTLIMDGADGGVGGRVITAENGKTMYTANPIYYDRAYDQVREEAEREFLRDNRKGGLLWGMVNRLEDRRERRAEERRQLTG